MLKNKMPTLVKIHRKGQMTLPSRLRSAIGVSEGDVVEATVKQGKIVLSPKLIIDRSQFPTAVEEYTPARRRIMDARLAEPAAHLKSGRFTGPFNTTDQMIVSFNG